MAAMEHLLELGHRRIALIRTSDTAVAAHSSELERSRGYYDSLERAEIAFRDEYLVTLPYGMDAGARGVERLLALDEPPTAVFAFSDEIALSALRAARAARRRRTRRDVRRRRRRPSRWPSCSG